LNCADSYNDIVAARNILRKGLERFSQSGAETGDKPVGLCQPHESLPADEAGGGNPAIVPPKRLQSTSKRTVAGGKDGGKQSSGSEEEKKYPPPKFLTAAVGGRPSARPLRKGRGKRFKREVAA